MTHSQSSVRVGMRGVRALAACDGLLWSGQPHSLKLSIFDFVRVSESLLLPFVIESIHLN